MTRPGALRAPALALLLAAAACAGPAAGQRVGTGGDRDPAGMPARPAQRVVALAPHLTELVYAAGGGDKLVGVIRYSDHPAAARALPVVGDAFALNLERIAQLRPDLVLVWHSGLGERQREQLRALGLALHESEIRRVEDIAVTLRSLGALLGTPVQADAAASELLRRWNALQARYSGRSPVRVFYQLWHQPLMTINGEHLITQAIVACGGVNVFAALPGLTPTVSWEAAAQSDPQLIAGARVDDEAAPQGRWNDLPQVDAVKNRRYAMLPPDLLGRMGPRFVEGAQLLCEALDRTR
jgi:iron complex transport system substrate-binding protein